MVAEKFFCNYEVNPESEWAVIEAGFPIVARGEHGEARAIESPTHRFFIATLFLPQAGSTPERPHPLLEGYAAAVIACREARALRR